MSKFKFPRENYINLHAEIIHPQHTNHAIYSPHFHAAAIFFQRRVPRTSFKHAAAASSCAATNSGLGASFCNLMVPSPGNLWQHLGCWHFARKKSAWGVGRWVMIWSCCWCFDVKKRDSGEWFLQPLINPRSTEGSRSDAHVLGWNIQQGVLNHVLQRASGYTTSEVSLISISPSLILWLISKNRNSLKGTTREVLEHV